MTDRKPTPKPPMITLRAGKLSATVPVELLPTLLRLAPAVRQASEGFSRLAPAARQASEGLARVRASIEQDTP